MNKQQRYKEAVKSIQINKLILNGITLLGVGTASFFCLSLFAKNLPFNLRAVIASSIGLTGGALVVSIKSSPLEDAIAAMYESGAKAYDEHRKQAAITRSSDLQAIQSVHRQGLELLDELKGVGTLIGAQVLLSEDTYANTMAQELMNNQADPNGYFFLQLPDSGNIDTQPRNLPGKSSDQPQIGGGEVIDFSLALQRKNRRFEERDAVDSEPSEPNKSSNNKESDCRDSFIGNLAARIDSDSSASDLSTMSSAGDPVMLI